MHDENAIKGNYKLAIVQSVKVSSDGLVRSCNVQYRIPSVKDAKNEYSGGKLITLSRSVQRLSLILAVEELSENVVVKDGFIVAESAVDQ